TYWGLDKKLVIGEFYAQTTDGVQQNDLYTNLYSSGYNGAWAWQYNDSGVTPQNNPIKWPSMQTAIQNVYNAHMTEISAGKWRGAAFERQGAVDRNGGWRAGPRHRDRGLARAAGTGRIGEDGAAASRHAARCATRISGDAARGRPRGWA